jgi:hypothetical protein
LNKTTSLRKEIKYVGFYDQKELSNKRVASIAAINKMDYVCDALIRAGFSVNIVSPSWFDNEISVLCYCPKTTWQLNKHKRLTLCPSIGTKTKYGQSVKIVLSLAWLFLWLVIHTKRNEKVLSYHSPWLSVPLRWAKRLKGFELILEVEEIYSKVWRIRSIMQKWETKVISRADSYIAVSEVLAEILGDKTKIILYGSYLLFDVSEKSHDHSSINIIYAGSIDHTKGGAYNAVKCAEYLPAEYVIHICGYGSSSEVKELERKIEAINAKLCRKACVFHGTKIGRELDILMKECLIAVNPQYEGENMNTAFPSKIMTYLSHNLYVISTRIRSVQRSRISSLVRFSESDNPESLAKSILEVKANAARDHRKVIMDLDREFVSDIAAMLG